VHLSVHYEKNMFELEESTSCEQFCGWSKNKHVQLHTKNIIIGNFIELVSLNHCDSRSV
jgi:hypothetical protein